MRSEKKLRPVLHPLMKTFQQLFGFLPDSEPMLAEAVFVMLFFQVG